MMKAFYKLITLFSVLCVNSAAIANEDPEQKQPKIDLDTEMITNIEVIEIKGSRTLTYYRRALKKAEKSLFNQYNKLTDNSDFKIICRMEQIATNTRKKEQTCKPRYEKILQAQDTQFAISRLGATLVDNRSSDVTSITPSGGVSSQTLGVSISNTVGGLLNVKAISQSKSGSNTRLNRKRIEHQEDMLKQLNKSPELAQKLLDYVIAKQKYELSRAASYQKD